MVGAAAVAAPADDAEQDGRVVGAGDERAAAVAVAAGRERLLSVGVDRAAHAGGVEALVVDGVVALEVLRALASVSWRSVACRRAPSYISASLWPVPGANGRPGADDPGVLGGRAAERDRHDAGDRRVELHERDVVLEALAVAVAPARVHGEPRHLAGLIAAGDRAANVLRGLTGDAMRGGEHAIRRDERPAARRPRARTRGRRSVSIFSPPTTAWAGATEAKNAIPITTATLMQTNATLIEMSLLTHSVAARAR